MKYEVKRRFKDAATGRRHRPGGIYDTGNAARAAHLQKLGFLGKRIDEPAKKPVKKAETKPEPAQEEKKPE